MVALSRKREVFSWGYGAEGQGGHGSLLHMRTPRRVSSLQEVPVAQVCVQMVGCVWSAGGVGRSRCMLLLVLGVLVMTVTIISSPEALVSLCVATECHRKMFRAFVVVPSSAEQFTPPWYYQGVLTRDCRMGCRAFVSQRLETLRLCSLYPGRFNTYGNA